MKDDEGRWRRMREGTEAGRRELVAGWMDLRDTCMMKVWLLMEYRVIEEGR